MPLPIQRFCPCRVQLPSGSRWARVASRTTSLPCSGSVSAKAPSLSTAAIARQPAGFCSSEPSSPTAVIASPECTALKVAMLPSPRASSAATRPSATRRQTRAAEPAQRPARDAQLPVAGHERNGNSARSQ